MLKIFRSVLAVIGVVLLANAAYLWCVSNCNVGLILLTAIGAILVIYAAFMRLIHKLLDNKFGALVKVLLLLATAYFAFTSTMITMSATSDTATFNEDAVIVLGAAVRGEQVTLPLAYRLNAAINYHTLNPDAYIIVSGGQGNGENVTEAEAMEKYLTERGVNPEKIVPEIHATSTYENFLFSKQILDKLLPNGYEAAYITNGFHIFRAGRLAKTAGITVHRMHAQSSIITLLPDYLRECCAIGLMWITNK